MNIEELLRNKFKEGAVIVEKIKNKGSSLTQEYSLKIHGYGQIIFEFYLDKKKNVNEFENINGLNLTLVEKVLADKMFASVDFFLTGNLEQENRIRHVVDILHIVKNYDLDNGLVKKFIKERISNELDKLNEAKFDKGRIMMLKNICINFKEVSLSVFSEVLLDEDGKINKEFNQRIKEDTLYEKSNFLNKKTYDNLIKIIGGYNG